MYHPEYNLLDFIGTKKWKIVGNEITDEIAFRLSLLMNRWARKNSNKVYNGIYINKEMSISRIPSQPMHMGGDVDIYAYGYNY
jgi:hypothetical protein